MHFTLQKVSRIENGQLLSYHELPVLLALYGVPTSDHGPYIELWKKAKKRPWWRAYDLPAYRYIRMEEEAHHKTEFNLVEVPTLLQTETYARNAVEAPDVATAEAMVKVRMRQQQRLTTEPLLHLHALIHESALNRGVDHDQTVRLIELAELPNVTIQIVSHDP